MEKGEYWEKFLFHRNKNKILEALLKLYYGFGKENCEIT